jgi:DNA-binding NarL/FixJ family response regulator
MKVVVLTAYDDDAYVRGLVAAGAVGYVLKDEAPETVVRAIRAVAQGDTWFSHTIVQKLTRMGEKQTKVPSLSEREREILDLVARGWSNARIGSKLGLATQTVRNYLCGVYPRLGVASRAEAIIWARERGLGRL